MQQPCPALHGCVRPPNADHVQRDAEFVEIAGADRQPRWPPGVDRSLTHGCHNIRDERSADRPPAGSAPTLAEATTAFATRAATRTRGAGPVATVEPRHRTGMFRTAATHSRGSTPAEPGRQRPGGPGSAGWPRSPGLHPSLSTWPERRVWYATTPPPGWTSKQRGWAATSGRARRLTSLREPSWVEARVRRCRTRRTSFGRHRCRRD